MIWAEENKKMYFRSALELLRLIDDALRSDAEDFAKGGTAEESE